MKNIIWLSANTFGLRGLEYVANDSVIKNNKVMIVTLSEGTKTKMYDGVDKHEWKKFCLPVEYVKDSSELESCAKRFEPDLIFMMGWRQMLPSSLLTLPKLGVVGFHPTLLPKGRGPAPIINTILNGCIESGVTMFFLSEKVDAGDIIGQERFSVESYDTATTVYEKVVAVGCKLIQEFLPMILDGTAPRTSQDENRATYFKSPTKQDNMINPNDPWEVNSRKIRALSSPYNGAYMISNGKKIIFKSEVVNE